MIFQYKLLQLNTDTKNKTNLTHQKKGTEEWASTKF